MEVICEGINSAVCGRSSIDLDILVTRLSLFDQNRLHISRAQRRLSEVGRYGRLASTVDSSCLLASEDS